MKTGFVSMSTFNRNFTRFLGTSATCLAKKQGERTQHPLLKEFYWKKYGKKPAFSTFLWAKSSPVRKTGGLFIMHNI